MADQVLPVVHSNGTSRAELLEQRRVALAALKAASDALAAMTPNARDYYPVAGLFEQAMRQHEERRDALLSLRADLNAEYVALHR